MRVELVGGPKCGMVYDMNSFMMDFQVEQPEMRSFYPSKNTQYITLKRWTYRWDGESCLDGSRKFIYSGVR